MLWEHWEGKLSGEIDKNQTREKIVFDLSQKNVKAKYTRFIKSILACKLYDLHIIPISIFQTVYISYYMNHIKFLNVITVCNILYVLKLSLQ